MTQNQIAFQKAQEEARANRVREAIDQGKLKVDQGKLANEQAKFAKENKVYLDEYGYDPGENPRKMSRYKDEQFKYFETQLNDNIRSIFNAMMNSNDGKEYSVRQRDSNRLRLEKI